MINNNIDFETGENYLRKQEENISNKLINQNPILPYAFILYEDNIKKIRSMNLNFNIDQMVPLLSYSDINEGYIVNGKDVEISSKLHIICLYDSKMIYTDNLESYMAELDSELEEVKEKLDHYNEELIAARNDSYIITQFNYEINYIHNLESTNNKLLEEITKTENKINELENIKDKNTASIEEFRKKINSNENARSELENKKNKLKEFLEKDRAYLNNKSLLKQYSNAKNKFDNEKEIINKQIVSLNKSKENLSLEYQDVSKKIEDKDKRYHLYKAVKDGIIEEDTIENMEERLRVLTNEITSDLDKLEKELETKNKELDEIKDNLKSFNLEEKCYKEKDLFRFLLC